MVAPAGGRAVDRLGEALGPVVGAAAMSLGIVSIALHLAGFEQFSRMWLVAGLIVWLGLVPLMALRWVRDRRRWLRESRTPAALTGVAATTVLGTRFALLDWHVVAGVALVSALAVWLILVPVVLRHWVTPTVGASFLLCVATQGVAVLSAVLAAGLGWNLLEIVAMLFFVLGLAAYGFVVARFSVRQLATGAGDHWVLAGALAITALAGGKIVLAAHALDWSGRTVQSLAVLAVIVEVVELAGYALLVGCEIRWPRLGFDLRRWSTVFPMGMTAAAAMTVGEATDHAVLRTVGRILVWPAVVVGVVMIVASLRWAWSVVRDADPRMRVASSLPMPATGSDERDSVTATRGR